ncbi:MAG: AAA family ATPase [Hyphomicrobiales bacterium]|nr:AAA family ATPase [Hyphomicrobiales bacterium]
MRDASAGEIAKLPPGEAFRRDRADDFDLGVFGRAIRARARPILGLTLMALIGSFVYVNLVTPRYKGEAEVLIESADNFYTRPATERDAGSPPAPVDDEAVQSQVLLMSSRELALDAIRHLHLVGNPEFDPLAGPPQPWMRLLILAGLAQNPANLAPEDRVLDKFQERLRIYPARGSRVVNVEFTSMDPRLAADAANTVTDLYLATQEAAKRSTARSAGAWLSSAIEPLRKKVDDAEARVESFRAQNGLLQGTNNVTINAQQLADLNAQLANARAAQADALSKAKLLREAIQSGHVLELSEVANNELIRRLSEQRATLSAQLALEGRTLLPQHPRMKELAAELADLDKGIKLAADKTVRGLENDARIAGSRVDSVNAALEAQKQVSSEANGKEVELRALERDAKAARDQLEAYTAKYREAEARDEDDKAVPADARIIARALVPATPSFPRKIPIIVIATLGTLVLAAAGVVAKELATVSGERRPVLPNLSWDKATGRRRSVEPSSAIAPAAPGTSVREDERVVDVPTPAVASTSVGEALKTPDEPPADLVIARDALMKETAAEPDGVVDGPASLQAEKANDSSSDEFAGIGEYLIALKPEERGVIVLVSRASDADTTPSFALALARGLSLSAATLLIDLDRQQSGPVTQGRSRDEAKGVSELIANEIGFAEAIHRDPSTQLHIVPAGFRALAQDDSAAQALALLVQTFAQTYDAVIIDARCATEAHSVVTHALLAAADVALVVRGDADQPALERTLERFAAEKPLRLLAVEPANDDAASAEVVAA